MWSVVMLITISTISVVRLITCLLIISSIFDHFPINFVVII